MNPDAVTFEEWVQWAFDHPVAAETKDKWWRGVPDENEYGRLLDRPPQRALTFVSQLFENPLAHLSSYSDEQIDQGLNFIVFRACSSHFEGIVDRDIDLGLRLRCIRSLENLSRELFAPRCSDNVWIYTNPLNHMCDMLWDLVVKDAYIGQLNPDGTYQIVRDPEIDKEFLDTLARILAMPSIACQQSALHGLGHLVRETKLRANVVQQYLDDHSNLRDDLRKYAQKAVAGEVL
jgi:hypothetical protein